MSSMEAALADTSKLAPYRGRQVLAVAAKLTNAGDGLSQAQAIAPVEWEIGQEGYVIYKVVCAKHDHSPIDKDNLNGPLKLNLVLKASTAVVVDAAVAQAKIAEQEDLIREAQERAKNIVPLPGVAEAEKAARATKAAKATKATKKAAAPTGPRAVPDDQADDDGFHDPALAKGTTEKKA